MAQEMVVSFSALKDWRRCRQLHFYRRTMGLQKKLRPTPFKMGSLIHSAVEAYLMDEPWSDVITEARKEWDKMMIEEQEYYGDMPSLVEGIMEMYVQQYPNDPDITLAVELSFGDKEDDDYPPVELLPGLYMKGRIDWVLEDFTRGLGIWDHKSAKSQLPNEEHRMTDLQTAFYQRGWNNTPELVEEFGRCEHVGFNYILTKPPTIPEATQKGLMSQSKIATTEAVIRKAAEDLELNLEDPKVAESVEALIVKCARPASDWFARKPLHKPEYLVDNLINEARVIATEMKHMADHPYRDPEQSCTTFCEFYALCSAELLGLDTAGIIKADYTTKKEVK